MLVALLGAGVALAAGVAAAGHSPLGAYSTAAHGNPLPLGVFPALLSFPPKSAPQLCSLCAVAQKDVTAPFSLTLLLPAELSPITVPHSDN